MTPAQAFYNFALLPGWQKWKPIFRYGTITDITDGLAAVTLDASMVSSGQGLGINQSATLTDVDFEYMSCDDGAFSEGDEVLVKFENQLFANPKIVGFKEEPQACEMVVPYLRAGADVSDDGGYLVCIGNAVPLGDFGDVTELTFDTSPHGVLSPYGGGYPAPYEYDGQVVEYQIREYTDGDGRLWDEIPWMNGIRWDPVYYPEYVYYLDDPKPYSILTYEGGAVREDPSGEWPGYWVFTDTRKYGMVTGWTAYGDVISNIHTSYRYQWYEGDADAFTETWYATWDDVMGNDEWCLDQNDLTKYAAIFSLSSGYGSCGHDDFTASGVNYFIPGEFLTTTETRIVFRGLGHDQDIPGSSLSNGDIRFYNVNGKYVAMFIYSSQEADGGYKYYVGSAVEDGAVTVLDVTDGMSVNGENTDVLTTDIGTIRYNAPGLLLMGGTYDRGE
jgi:hypothetical protein